MFYFPIGKTRLIGGIPFVERTFDMFCTNSSEVVADSIIFASSTLMRLMNKLSGNMSIFSLSSSFSGTWFGHLDRASD